MLAINNLQYAYQDKSGNPYDYSYGLTMQAGQCVAIIGESGSGKSTLLELIAGFLLPQSGDIILDGNSLLAMPADKRPLSIVFQQDNLFNHISVYNNIALGLANKLPLVAEQDALLQKALIDTKLDGFATRLPEKLSGGQRQRVALLRALLRAKPILLLDEPFNGLNKAMREEYAQWINEYKQKNNAYIIWVTHDIEDVAEVADATYLMKDFTLQQQ